MPEPTSPATARAPEAVLSCGTAEQTRRVGRRLGERLHGGDVVVLSGSLGAGKTTFVQGLALGLGVTAPVTSPTFVLARHQRPDPTGPRADGPELVHVDAYRLAGALELDDLDLDSDLDRAVVVVEWGEGLAERLSARRVEVLVDRDGRTGAARRPDQPPEHPSDPPSDASDRSWDALPEEAGDEPRTLLVRVVGAHPDLQDPASLDPDAATPEPETPC